MQIRKYTNKIPAITATNWLARAAASNIFKVQTKAFFCPVASTLFYSFKTKQETV